MKPYLLTLAAALLLTVRASAQTVSGSDSTNDVLVAVSTNSVQVLPERTGPHTRLAVTIRPTVNVHLRWGAAATTSNLLLKADEVYTEAVPVIENRSLHIRSATTAGSVYIEEKLQ